MMSDRDIAVLFSEIDLFVDLSEYQAMGLTALEALAAGVPVVVPQNGGSNSFGQEGSNAVFVNTLDESECVVAIERLLTSHKLRIDLASNARRSVGWCAPEFAAAAFVRRIFGED